MFAGCFSWCRLHMPWGAKKESRETKLHEKPKSPLTIFPATAFAENHTEPKPDEELPENSQSVVPTKTDYAVSTVKEVLTLSQSAAFMIPVPFLKEAIGVALKIIQVCEEASDVEQKLKELLDKVGDLMIVIVDHVTLKEEGTKETVVRTAEGTERDIEKLLSILKSIHEDLTKISAQNRWAIAVYKQANMNAVEKCMNRLSTAMQTFTFANDLLHSAHISELLAHLRKMADKVVDMHPKVDDLHHKVDDIHPKVDNMHHEVYGMRKDIQTVLVDLKTLGARPESDTLARKEMPLKPEIFHGRDDMVEGISKLLLLDEPSRICLLGAGGMGKTSISLAVAELSLIKKRFLGRNLVWVPCIEATSANLLLDLLYTQLQVPGDRQVTLEKIISDLDTQKQPRLIMFDNFETPWNGNQTQVGNILRKLAMLNHIAILVTMRGKHAPCHNSIKWQSLDIKSTDEAASLRIYHDINPNSKNDPDVAKLLSVLGHMPFAITLLAKLGLESWWSAKDLLHAWSESGPDILSNDDPERSMNRSVLLSVESNLVKRNPNAIVLLAILSLLPAGTTKENLHWWAPALKMSMIPSAIATLLQTALLVENKRENSASPVLFVVPVVQSFMQQQSRITQEVREQVHLSCCEYVLAHACRFDDPTFPDKSKALAAEDTNIQSILFSPPPTDPSHKTMEALIAFSWYRCYTKPNLEIADYTVMAAKVSGVQKYIASSVWCLGRTYFQIANYAISYSHIQEAYQLFNTLPPGEAESQRLACLCGIDLVQIARHILDSDEVVSLAQDVEKKCAALSDDLIHGRGLVALGTALHDVQQWEKALWFMDKARTMFKAVENNRNLAGVCMTISWVHLHYLRFPDVLAALEDAWKYAKLTADRDLQTWISVDFVRFFFVTDQDTKVSKYIEIILENGSYIGNHIYVAVALNYMGYGYLRRGDYQNAYGAYEAAAEKFSGTIFVGAVELCKGNMTRIEHKRGNPDAVVGFHRPPHVLAYDKTLFYPPVQALSSELPVSPS